jgi:hypothetical protein
VPVKNGCATKTEVIFHDKNRCSSPGQRLSASGSRNPVLAESSPPAMPSVIVRYQSAEALQQNRRHSVAAVNVAQVKLRSLAMHPEMPVAKRRRLASTHAMPDQRVPRRAAGTSGPPMNDITLTPPSARGRFPQAKACTIAIARV